MYASLRSVGFSRSNLATLLNASWSSLLFTYSICQLTPNPPKWIFHATCDKKGLIFLKVCSYNLFELLLILHVCMYILSYRWALWKYEIALAAFLKSRECAFFFLLLLARLLQPLLQIKVRGGKKLCICAFYASFARRVGFFMQLIFTDVNVDLREKYFFNGGIYFSYQWCFVINFFYAFTLWINGWCKEENDSLKNNNNIE